MISYLGVTIDELLLAFEESCAFAEDRADRTLELPIEVDEIEDELSDVVASAEAGEDLEDEEDDEDEEASILVDEAGQLHTFGETISFAAEEASEFLTDYILADDIEADWLTLDQARGALLALRILLPELEEIEEVESRYSFTITRDGTTGYPNHIEMKTLAPEVEVEDILKHDAKAYTGTITDGTALPELFEAAGVPEDDRELLADVLTEGSLALAEEQCSFVIDVKGFAEKLAAARKAHTEVTGVETQH